MPGQLTVVERDLPQASGVLLDGELDLASAPGLGVMLGMLARSAERDVVVDTRGVGFIDSSGLSVLLNAERRLRRGGRRLFVVVDPSGPVARGIRLARLEGTLCTLDAGDPRADGLSPTPWLGPSSP